MVILVPALVILKAAKEGTRIVNETAESILTAVESSKIATENINKISNSTIEQAESIAQVTEGIEQIANVIQTNSATTEASAAASEELSGQAQLLKKLIDKFELKGSNERKEDRKVLGVSNISMDIPKSTQNTFTEELITEDSFRNYESIEKTAKY